MYQIKIDKEELNRVLGNVKYTRKEEFINIITDLAKYLTNVEEERKKAIDKLAEFNADERIKELEQKLKEARNQNSYNWMFNMEPEDIKKIQKWKKQHEEEKHNGSSYAGAIGGRYTYEFTPTSIGTFKRLRCSCGDYFDYDDGSNW